MATARILVTGAHGFVGRVVRERAGEDVEIVPLDTAQGKAIDIRDADAVTTRIRAIRPSAVIHLAAIASPREAARDPSEAWAVNLMGTFNIANAVMREASEARFVFAGSSEAYGASFEGAAAALDETARLAPRSPYGATKAACEVMLGQMIEAGLKATLFRPFNHTGAGQGEAYVVPSFARQVVRIERGLQPPVLKTGNLEARRDFLDARDVADAYLLAAGASDDRAVGTFNLASGRPVPIRALVEGLIELSPAAITVETDPNLLRPNEIALIAGNARKARETFGWLPKYDLAETLRDILDHWRSLADRSPEALL